MTTVLSVAAENGSAAASRIPAEDAGSARDAADAGLPAFMSVRPRLFGIAYRMLGRAAEAEDIVQDVWVRWQTADHRAVRNPTAFLVATTTRLAINVLQSARSRRETWAGPGLPEPVDTGADPSLGAERDEALRVAVLVLIEKLSPGERAAYVLREAFNYPYREIAGILRIEYANARQLVTRARAHLSDARRASVKSGERRRFVRAFVAAATTGDLAELERVLAADAASAPRLSRIGALCGHVGQATSSRSSRKGAANHEARHHRRHRPHRIEARSQAA